MVCAGGGGEGYRLMARHDGHDGVLQPPPHVQRGMMLSSGLAGREGLGGRNSGRRVAIESA